MKTVLCTLALILLTPTSADAAEWRGLTKGDAIVCETGIETDNNRKGEFAHCDGETWIGTFNPGGRNLKARQVIVCDGPVVIRPKFRFAEDEIYVWARCKK